MGRMKEKKAVCVYNLVALPFIRLLLIHTIKTQKSHLFSFQSISFECLQVKHVVTNLYWELESMEM